MQSRINSFMSSALVGVSILFAACEQKTANTGSNTGTTPEIVLTAINSACPYSGKPIDPAMTVAAHDSVNIGFCCKGCKAKFEMLDHAGQDAVVAKIKAATENPAPAIPEGEAPIIATPAETGG